MATAILSKAFRYALGSFLAIIFYARIPEGADAGAGTAVTGRIWAMHSHICSCLVGRNLVQRRMVLVCQQVEQLLGIGHGCLLWSAPGVRWAQSPILHHLSRPPGAGVHQHGLTW